MKKDFVIYTAVIGYYDIVHQPLIIDERFNYILFSDVITDPKIGVWEVRHVDYQNPIPTKIARYVKTHPELLLREYKSSVWIDASFLITSDYIYNRAIELVNNRILIATHLHQDWTCTYQEMVGMMKNQWETEEVTVEWGRFLRNEHFPREIGTWETGVLFRIHSDPKIAEFDTLWWWCIQQYSRRDQYAFRYVLWKLDIDCVSFLPKECDVRNQEHYKLMQHQTRSKLVTQASHSWIWRYYIKHTDDRTLIENIYYWIYDRRFPYFWISIIGQGLRIKHWIDRWFFSRTCKYD